MSRNETIKHIARDILRVETLKPRGRDCLDFHDNISVWSIKEALEAAYDACAETVKYHQTVFA